MSGAQMPGWPSTTMPRTGVPKWLVCHTIKAAATYLVMGKNGYVVCFFFHAISSLCQFEPFTNIVLCFVF